MREVRIPTFEARALDPGMPVMQFLGGLVEQAIGYETNVIELEIPCRLADGRRMVLELRLTMREQALEQ